MLNEIIEELYEKYPDLRTNSESDISLAGAKIFLVNICKKYNNPEDFDKLKEAEMKVNDVKIDIGNRVNQMIHNEEHVRDLQVQSELNLEQAKNINKQGRKMSELMKERNMKLWVIIGCFILALLLYIVVPIIVASQE